LPKNHDFSSSVGRQIVRKTSPKILPARIAII
jgi:hypothetical protein